MNNLDEAAVREETNDLKNKVRDHLMGRKGIECRQLERELIEIHGEFNYRRLAFDRLGLFLYAIAQDVFIVTHEPHRDPYDKQTPLFLFIRPSCLQPDNQDEDTLRLLEGHTVNGLIYCKNAKVLKNRTSIRFNKFPNNPIKN